LKIKERINVTEKMKKMNIRNSILLPIALFVLILPLISCGGKDVKPVTPESKLTLEAFELAETLRSAYLENDRETLEQNSTKDGYRELLGAIKSFDKAELSFTPTWVEIQDTTVNLSVSWKGTWTVKGKTTEERGIALFVLEGKPLKLSQIQRANPFRQPE
jgi:hypothetical protein